MRQGFKQCFLGIHTQRATVILAFRALQMAVEDMKKLHRRVEPTGRPDGTPCNALTVVGLVNGGNDFLMCIEHSVSPLVRAGRCGVAFVMGAKAVDQRRAGLVESDHFDIGAFSAEFGDHFVECTHRSDIPEVGL